ncbi:MAG: hypothetical protein WKG07_04840 [Hymenobacter sp.]
MFFSATMSKPIMELTKKYQRDPQVVKVNHQTDDGAPTSSRATTRCAAPRKRTC